MVERGSLRRRGWVVGVVALMASSAWAQTVHIVNQVGDSFEPADITILQGDSVRWVWSSGDHTVTHGEPCTPDPNPLFDANLNMFSPQFEFQFTALGRVPYFCQPHCLFGMTGTVTVAPPCDGRESIVKARCRNHDGVNKMTVKVSGVPGDTFTVTLSSDGSKSGTIGDRGTGKVKFRDLPSGPGVATARFGCGAKAMANYDCP